jgi:hypothetical protein
MHYSRLTYFLHIYMMHTYARSKDNASQYRRASNLYAQKTPDLDAGCCTVWRVVSVKYANVDENGCRGRTYVFAHDKSGSKKTFRVI